MSDVVIDGIVTDFVAVMQRIGALSESDQEAFRDAVDEATTPTEPENYVEGMNAIGCYFE